MYGENFVDLIYGRSGTGKTSLALSYPKPLLLVDINDRAYLAARGMKGVDVEIITHWQDFERLAEKAAKKDYATRLWDTATGLQLMCARHVAVTYGKSKKKEAPKVIKYGTLTLQQWGEVAVLMQSALLDWRDMDGDLVITCQEKIIKEDVDSDKVSEHEEEAKIVEVVPNLIPSLVNVFCSASTLVGRMFIQEIERKVDGKFKLEFKHSLRVGPHPYIYTNVKKPVDEEIPDIISNVTHKKLERLIYG